MIGTHHDPHGVIIRQRPGGEIPDARLLARPRRGIARGAPQTHDLHAGRPHVHKQVVIDKVRPVVRAHENPVAAHIRENGILDGDVIGVGHVDCPLARHGPVAAHQSFIRRVEQRPVCLRENEVGQGDIFHRVVGGRAAEAGQFRDRRRFDGGGGQVQARRGPIIKAAGRLVVKPFVRGVQFLKQVFHHHIGGTQGAAPVVVPHPGHDRHAGGSVEAGDLERIAAPLAALQTAHQPGGGIGPARRPVAADAGGVIPVQNRRPGTVIRIPGKHLRRAVHEQAVEIKVRGDGGHHDVAGRHRPGRVQPDRPAPGHHFIRIGRISDRHRGGARILRGESDGLPGIIGSPAQPDSERPGGGRQGRPDGCLRLGQGQKRRGEGARIRIAAIGGHKEIGRRPRHQTQPEDDRQQSGRPDGFSQDLLGM